MKTVKKFTEESISKIRVNKANLDHISTTGVINGSLYIDLIQLSKQIAEFAQRWIPVEEELPTNESGLLLVKWLDKSGSVKYGLATYMNFFSLGLSKAPYMDFTIQGSCKREVTHWRPVELQ